MGKVDFKGFESRDPERNNPLHSVFMMKNRIISLVIAGDRPKGGLLGSPPEKNGGDCLDHDPKIKKQGGMLDILKIQIHPLLEAAD